MLHEAQPMTFHSVIYFFFAYILMHMTEKESAADIDCFVHKIVREKITEGLIRLHNTSLEADIPSRLSLSAHGMFVTVFVLFSAMLN